MTSPANRMTNHATPPRISAALSLLFLAFFATALPAMANTAVYVASSATDLSTTAAYTAGALPGTTGDLLFDVNTTYANPTGMGLSAANLSVGTIDDLNATALVIGDTNNRTITLNGGSNSVGGTANDDIYVAGGASMNLGANTIIASTVTSAYFDSAGTLTVGLVSGSGVTIADTSNATSLTFNGAGSTTINGTSAFGASATNTSTVTLNNTGGGAVVFAGPTVLTNGTKQSNLTVNASSGPITLTALRSAGAGSAVTLEGTNTITINSGYVSGYGTGAFVDAGSFYVTETGAGTVVKINGPEETTNGATGWYYTVGAGTTLDLGAASALNSTLNIAGGTLDNTSGGSLSTTFLSPVASNTTNIDGGFTWGGTAGLVLNGAATLGTSSGTAVTVTGSGSGLLEISGAVSNGTTANQLILANGYYELGGTGSTYSGGTVIQSGTLITVASNALGTGGITLGTASGTALVKLLITGGSDSNPVTTIAGDTGTMEIGNSAATSSTESGLITLNTNLLVAQAAVGSISLTGTLAGSSNPSTPVIITTNGPSNDITLGSIQDGSGSGSSVSVVNSNFGNVNIIAPGTYSGGTQIPTGSVTAAASGALGSGPVTLGTSSGGLSAGLYINGGLETNAVTVDGTATMTIANSTAASSTESGLITLNDNLQVTQANGGSLNFTGTFIGSSLSGTATTLTFAPSTSGTVYVANISDGSSPVSVTASGPGTTVFDGTNTYSGATTISGGLASYQGNAAFDSTGGITQSSTTGAIQLQGNISSSATTVLTISGTGGLTGATGALDNVSGNNSLANPIVIATGPTTISSDSGSLTLTGGVTGAHTLDLVSTNTGAITFTSGTLNNLTIANIGAGTGVVTINAPIGSSLTGGITQSSTSSLLILAGANTYSGNTTVSAGATLQYQGYSAMSGSSTLALANNSTIELLADTSGTFAPASISLPTSGSTAIFIDVGALTTGSNNTVTLTGNMSFPDANPALPNSLNVTASNGDTLVLGSGLNLPTSNTIATTTINTAAGTILDTGTITNGGYGQTLTFAGSGTVNISAIGFASNGTSALVVGNGSNAPTVNLLGTPYISQARSSGNFSATVNSGILNLDIANDLNDPNGSATTLTLNANGTLDVNVANALEDVTTFTINGGTLNNIGAAAVSGADEGSNSIAGDFAWSGSNSLVLNGASTLAGTGAVRTITTGGTGILAFNGAISGAYGLTENGSGVLQFNGANTYNGGFTLNGGEAVIDAAKALGTGTFVLNGGGLDNNSGASITATNSFVVNNNFSWFGTNTLFMTGSTALSGSSITVTTAGTAIFGFSGVVSGSAQLVENGSGVVNMGAADTYSGGFVLNGGQVNDNNAAAFGTAPLTINGGAIDNTSSAALTNTNAVQVNGDFAYRGTHSITWSGPVALAGTNRTIATAGISSLIITGTLSGSSQLTVAGSGLLELNATNSYSGGTVLNSGTLQVGTGSAENVNSLSTGPVTLNGGILQFEPGSSSSTYTFGNNFTFNGGTLLAGDGFQVLTGSMSILSGGATLVENWNNKGLSINGPLYGSGPITIQGSPTTGAVAQETLADTAITQITASNYTGTLTVNGTGGSGAVLILKSQYELADANVNIMGTGTSDSLQFTYSNSVNFNFGGLGGNGNLLLQTTGGSAVSLTVGASNSNTLYSGAMNGTGSLTTVGTGTLILSGSSTYTGLTTVSSGALIVSGSISGAVINSGTIGGGGSIGGLVTAYSGSVIAPGALETGSAGAVLSLDGGLTMGVGSSLTINLDSSDNIDSLAVNGNLAIYGSDTLTLNLLSGAALDQPFYVIATVTNGSFTGTGSLVDATLPANYQIETVGNDIELVAAVPEPGTVGILLAGLGMLVGLQRRRRLRVGR